MQSLAFNLVKLNSLSLLILQCVFSINAGHKLRPGYYNDDEEKSVNRSVGNKQESPLLFSFKPPFTLQAPLTYCSLGS